MAKSAPKATFNVFDTAPALPKVVKNSKGKVKPTFKLAGLDKFAQYKTAIAAAEGLCVELRSTMDPILYNYFAEEGCKIHRKPDNADGLGEEGIGLGSLELRKRSTLSPLSPEEQEFLAENEVPTETVIVTPATFIINPKFLSDAALMKKVGEALAAIGVPVDMTNPENSFIQRQQEVSKVVVSDETIDATYKKKPSVAREILPVVTTLGIRPKLAAGVTLDTALKTLLNGLQANPDLVNEAMTDPSKLNRKNEEASKRKPRAKAA
jgi:hypothetical protein